MQVVEDRVDVPVREIDLTGFDERPATSALEALCDADRVTPFDMADPPLLRLMLVDRRPSEYRLVLTNHHILLDGWSMPLLIRELLLLYATDGDAAALPPVHPYRDYLAWLVPGRTSEAARAAWARRSAGRRGADPARAGRPRAAQLPEVARRDTGRADRGADRGAGRGGPRARA